MIPQIHDHGSNTGRLLAYLYGPGRSEEHTDPHLVAAWDSLVRDPGRDPQATLRALQELLDQPVNALPKSRRPAEHVWHISIRNAPEDPILSDDDWADIARRMVAATGIDTGKGAGCRWAAVRHAEDHIHIIATRVREDGRQARHHNDAKRAQAEARLLEVAYGLRQLNTGDGTAASHPTRAEHHKAERTGRERTAREELRETVRRAVAGAEDEAEFFDRLGRAGLLIHTKAMPSGDLAGYSVALPDDLTADGDPVFYSGSTLAPDLSLPRLRQRFSTPDGHDAEELLPASATGRSGRRPAPARRRTAEAAWAAILVIDDGSDCAAAAQITAAGEVLDALAATSAAHTRRELREAAAAFERASRSHVRAERRHSRALRRAARDLVYSGPALGRGEDGAGTAMAIDMLVFLVMATAHWHWRKQHAQQAAAARQAADHLRAAYRNAAGPPLKAASQRGRALPGPVRDRQAAAVRTALPELAEQILAEPGWHALAATLTDAEAAGKDPARLLAQAAARRELGSAESISDVLIWRLRRTAGLPADPTGLRRHATSHTAAPNPPTQQRRSGRDPGRSV
ncbi:relaxase/mobilization nuclease domain-containing protein [Actinacidiphila rubida]|uniref:Relaxase/Mobilisation nuclease domain-containing protein n=1 Tax=Actinacidiphila rubida TaxID=310780 RepID=A0A1H8S662_9ACTN|nr:relaxase/mobilization nuclease domain-containing protein [Actinacidiphila rubida]SEO74026.1 Relaxase/Mobilisation nuclease domain-containing protein [Actinacidiphila rubida]